MQIIERYQQAQQKLISILESKDCEKEFKTKQIFRKKKENMEKVKYFDSCKFLQDWTYACRGSTLFLENGKVVKAVFSLNKFFNYRDLSKNVTLYKTDIRNGKTFVENGMDLFMTEKLDGSNVQVFYDDKGKCFIHTLGTLEEFKIGSSNITFSEATKRGLSEYKKIDEYLQKNPYQSCVFELVTKWNPIITKYSFQEKDIHLHPLVIIKDGLPRWDVLQEIGVFENGVPPNAEIVTGDLETSLKAMEKKIRSNPRVFGENPEGIVVYATYKGVAIPFCKYKFEEYLQASEEKKSGYSPEKALMELQVNDLNGKEIGESTEEQMKHLLTMRKAIEEIVGLIPTESTKKDFVMKVKSIRRLDKVSSEILKNFSTIEKGDRQSWIVSSLSSLQSRHGHEWFL